MPRLPAKEFRYAGFWVRAAARAVDILVIVGIYNLFYLVDRYGATAGLWTPSGLEDAFPADRLNPGNVVRAAFFFGFPIFYYVYLHGAYGQTFGKMALKIRVINEDGTPLDFRKSFIRWLGYFLCVFTLYIGYLMIAFDRRKQGLHDRVCRTLVIHDNGTQARDTGTEPPAQPVSPPPYPPPIPPLDNEGRGN
ncbi:MAG: RDD family protein [Deltaproteobacteria bacterium]|nr:RDD family protein [Deltaproteobacteria bacterium]